MNANPFRSIYLYLRYDLGLTVRNAWVNCFCYKSVKLTTMDYEKYWEGDHSKGFTKDSRMPVFLQLIQSGSRVVEIGCGDGTLLALLKEQKHVVGKGYDISSLAIQKARAKGVDAEVRDAITSGLAEADEPDYIVISDCLEHLPRPEELLDRLRGQFKKAILISIPNSCYWRYRFRVLFGKFMVQWVAHPGEHLRYWSISDMHWWLGILGFVAHQTYPTWGVPLLKRIWPSMFAQNVIYVVTEDPAASDARLGRSTS